MSTEARNKIIEVAATGGHIYVSHSGGKDSQAMYAWAMATLPANKITVVHADLGRVEWTGVQDHIRDTIKHPLNVVQAIDKDGNTKTLVDLVRRRSATRPEVPSWPSSATRQCTSDLKRDPIHKFIRRHMKENGHTLAVNATGLRAEESPARAKRTPLTENKRLSAAGRTVFDASPIHDWTIDQVWNAIKEAGQKPFWAYAEGNSRLSCVFCIMACDTDLANGARNRPELLREYLELERETGWTMFNGKSLAERLPADLVPADLIPAING